MEKFCYECGKLEKEADSFIDGMCAECYLERNRIVKTPKELTLQVCGTCMSYSIKNKFNDVELNPHYEYLEAAKELVSKEAEVLQDTAEGLRFEDFEDSEGVDIAFEAEYAAEKTINVKINARAKFFDTETPLTDETETVIKIQETTCEICNKQKTGYYEAILQIRGEEDIPQSKLQEIYRKLEQKFEKSYGESRKEFVSKIKQKHGGLNLFVSSSQVAKELGRFLKKEYNVKIKETAELVGETSDGQKNYRVTVMVRIPEEAI